MTVLLYRLASDTKEMSVLKLNLRWFHDLSSTDQTEFNCIVLCSVVITWSNLNLHQYHSCGLIYPLIYSLIIYILLISLSVDDRMQHSGFYTSNACFRTNILQGKNIFHLLYFHSESKYPAATKERLSPTTTTWTTTAHKLFLSVSLCSKFQTRCKLLK